MEKYSVNCADLQSESEFWAIYIESVNARNPEKFGRNLDALWDALHAGGPGSPESRDCKIIVLHSEALKRFRDGYFHDHLSQIAYDLRSDPGGTVALVLK
ncbi:barstar family protein [Biformimicrobium ophioploci]|uniref:Barstar (barnase inhibitor) domain-containing protein n=1 Tax=Biformimicrobium ophioploci TaxID=3036711 RepID=A0ABQ6M352_9GAMM|nr:hypothetical protein MNKW57_31000 [Microbulbifer sp. NKW57]